jgi:5-methyltetrahydrofolate--homocysteine methyltransferase
MTNVRFFQGTEMETNIAINLAQGNLLLADGGTGSMLMEAGLPPGFPPEAWNVEHPEQVLALHHAYLEAGSQVILTNTFGGNRIKLAKFGMGESAREFNLSAVKLARQAADGKAYVAGDIGPCGEMMAPMGKLTYDLAFETFSEQATALVEGGVDLIWVETMSDLNEARAAVVGARQATDLPIFCSLSFGKKARTMMGVSPRQAAQELWPLGLNAIGANCGEGLEMIPEVLKQMREVLPNAPLIAKPNAGLPRLAQGKTVYDQQPAEFASRMVEFIALGAQVVGGCCGSGPAHIAALSKSITSR